MSFSRMRFDSPPPKSSQQTSTASIQQDPHKRQREESAEESTGEAPVKRQRTGSRHPWPRHFYNAEGMIPCQAQGCDRVFNDDRRGDQKRISHVTGTSGAEHRIIECMDRQIGCSYCEYRVVTQRRQLFNHEETAHGTRNMSTLTSFIGLARRGDIVGDLGTRAAQPIFDRMIRTIYNEFPSVPRLLYYRVHRQVVDEVEQHDLIKILAPHWTGPEDGTLPGTTLVHPKDFLWDLHPNWVLPTREEVWWSEVWWVLRDMYTRGVI